MLKLLEREQVLGGIEHDSSIDPDLANRAADLLSYSRLKTERLTIQVGTSPLHVILREIDVMPFTPRSVRRYKAEKVAESKKSFFDFSAGACVILGLCGIIATILGIMLLLAIGINPSAALLTFTGAAGMFFLGLVWLTISGDEVVDWQAITIEKYDDRIPAFVLETACAIKEKIPSAKFEIEQIYVQKIKHEDPFLVLVLGKDRFYLEVWNEPGFEKKREA